MSNIKFKGTIKRTAGSTFNSKFSISVPIVIEAINPASASNLEVWLSADSGTDKIGNGEIVSFWDDLSGNGRNFNNLGNTLRRPKFRTSQSISGRPAVSFGEGSSTWMLQSAGSKPDFLTNGSSSTIFTVIKVDTNSGFPFANEAIFDNTEFGTQRGAALRHDNTRRLPGPEGDPAGDHLIKYEIRSSVGRIVSAETVTGSSVLGNQVALISVTHDSGSFLEIFIDGISRATSSTFSQAYETESSPNAMTLADIGDSRTGVNAYDGDIFEIIQYSDLKSVADREGIEKYLTDKYEIS